MYFSKNRTEKKKQKCLICIEEKLCISKHLSHFMPLVFLFTSWNNRKLKIFWCFQGVKKGLDVICASHTTVCLFLLKRTWNFFSQSFVKWADEQVLHLISMLVLSFNNALQLSHILCFIKLSSSMYENLHDSISSFRAKSSWTKFSFSGICFSTVQTSILISLVVRYF